MADTLPTLTAEIIPLDTGKLCQYELESGQKCNSPKVLARGFCERHYRSLKRAGAFEVATKTRTPSEVTARNVAAVRKARKKLLKLAPDFVDHLVAGSQIASKTGDTRAAQWALLHTRTVEPVSEKQNSSVNTGTTINIGVKVSGVEGK
jgi:hypothetical protein